MKRIFIILLVLIIFVFSAHSQNEEPVHFKGKVLDKEIHFIPFVNILILNKDQGIAADYNGQFSLMVEKNDTLLFTAVGYKSTIHVIPDTLTSFEYYRPVILEVDTFLLKMAVVYPWPATVAQLKREYLELELPDETIDLRLPLKIDYVNYTSDGNVGITFSGPISFLYEKFSREAKMRRLYERLVIRDKQEEYIASRISKNMIEKITGLKDPDKIEAFMEYCDLSYEFIIASTDYKIGESIKECYSRYIKDPE